MEWTFSAEIFEWRGPAPFYWLALPREIGDGVRADAPVVTYGWGAIPVSVCVGAAEWETSLLSKDGGYVLPVKKAVRDRERIELGDVVTVAMTVAPRRGRAANGDGPTV